jgi:hypothetical protein
MSGRLFKNTSVKRRRVKAVSRLTSLGPDHRPGCWPMFPPSAPADCSSLF